MQTDKQKWIEDVLSSADSVTRVTPDSLVTTG